MMAKAIGPRHMPRLTTYRTRHRPGCMPICTVKKATSETLTIGIAKHEKSAQTYLWKRNGNSWYYIFLMDATKRSLSKNFIFSFHTIFYLPIVISLGWRLRLNTSIEYVHPPYQQLRSRFLCGDLYRAHFFPAAMVQ